MFHGIYRFFLFTEMSFDEGQRLFIAGAYQGVLGRRNECDCVLDMRDRTGFILKPDLGQSQFVQ